MPTVDASSVCPGAPAPPAGCTTKFSLGNGGCGVLCTATQRRWADAANACKPNWRLGVLDSPAKLAAVPQVTDLYWVGAGRLTSVSAWLWTTGTAVDPNAWKAGEPAAGNGDNCVIFDGQSAKLDNSSACADTERYVCTTP